MSKKKREKKKEAMDLIAHIAEEYGISVQINDEAYVKKRAKIKGIKYSTHTLIYKLFGDKVHNEEVQDTQRSTAAPIEEEEEDQDDLRNKGGRQVILIDNALTVDAETSSRNILSKLGTKAENQGSTASNIDILSKLGPKSGDKVDGRRRGDNGISGILSKLGPKTTEDKDLDVAPAVEPLSGDKVDGIRKGDTPRSGIFSKLGPKTTEDKDLNVAPAVEPLKTKDILSKLGPQVGDRNTSKSTDISIKGSSSEKDVLTKLGPKVGDVSAPLPPSAVKSNEISVKSSSSDKDTPNKDVLSKLGPKVNSCTHVRTSTPSIRPVNNDANTKTTPTQPLTAVSSSAVNINTYSPRLVVEVQQGRHKLSGRKRKVSEEDVVVNEAGGKKAKKEIAERNITIEAKEERHIAISSKKSQSKTSLFGAAIGSLSKRV